MDLGVAPYLVGASLIGVVAQRLVRKICPNCKEEYHPPGNLRKIVEKWDIEIPTYYRGLGCRKCRNTGYIGRIAIHELFVPNEEILDLIATEGSIKDIRQGAYSNGMLPLHYDGLEKVKAGITTLEEILRVTNVSS